MGNSAKYLTSWRQHILTYRIPIFSQTERYIDFHGKGAELGAGTCWLASLLSKNPKVDHVSIFEIDSQRIKLARTHFCRLFGAVTGKIEFFNDDFHSLPFADASLDFVVCDAALHHSDRIADLLQEIHRILKPNGVLLALREPVLPSLQPLRTWKRLTFGWRERLLGDIEKTYTKQEWLRSFGTAQFHLSFYEYFLGTTLKERIVRCLRKWNGLLFSRYFFIARPL